MLLICPSVMFLNCYLSGIKMNQQLEKLLEAVAQENNCKNWNLWRRHNPEIEIDLRDVDLSLANLSGANLSKARMTGSRFTRTILHSADLTGAILDVTDLTGADLNQATLQNARLTGANLSRADLRKTDLQKANLQGASVTECCLEDSNLKGAILTEVDLSGINLGRAYLENTDLTHVDLSYAILTGTDIHLKKVRVASATNIRCECLELGKKQGTKVLYFNNEDQIQALEDCLENPDISINDLYKQRRQENKNSRFLRLKIWW